MFASAQLSMCQNRATQKLVASAFGFRFNQLLLFSFFPPNFCFLICFFLPGDGLLIYQEKYINKPNRFFARFPCQLTSKRVPTPRKGYRLLRFSFESTRKGYKGTNLQAENRRKAPHGRPLVASFAQFGFASFRPLALSQAGGSGVPLPRFLVCAAFLAGSGISSGKP